MRALELNDYTTDEMQNKNNKNHEHRCTNLLMYATQNSAFDERFHV